MRRFILSAAVVAAAVIATGVAVASSPPSNAVQAGSAPPALPIWLHKTVDAGTYVAPTAPFVPNIEPAGNAVPGNDVKATTTEKGKLKFGLATFRTSTQTYPAISTDGGATWKVDGPLFHVDALQGASVVGNSGFLPPRGAYFWGNGGNIVWITYDEGAHWWKVVFGAGVDEMSAKNRTLEVVAFGAQVHATELQRFLYISTDSGRTWRARRQLADLHI